MTPETTLKNKIMLDCGKRGWICLHLNVGTLALADGTYMNTGIPTGWPDLLIITNTGINMYVETKIRPRKPTKKQVDTINLLKEKKHFATIIYDFAEWADYVEQVIF
jgi:hypothetical protein